jgi:hypothetical protein
VLAGAWGVRLAENSAWQVLWRTVLRGVRHRHATRNVRVSHRTVVPKMCQSLSMSLGGGGFRGGGMSNGIQATHKPLAAWLLVCSDVTWATPGDSSYTAVGAWAVT